MLIELSRQKLRLVTARSARTTDVISHREDVVRRLLQRGLSPETLRVILPDFRDLIDRLSDGVSGDERAARPDR